MKWEEVKISDIKAKTGHALSTGPFGSSISAKFFQNEGVPVIRGSNLSTETAVRLSEENLTFISPELAKKFERSSVIKGDLVFTCWGTINQIGLIDERATYEKYIVSNKQMKLTPDPERVSSLFLYYYFSTNDVQQTILACNIGSSVPGFNLGQLKEFRVPLPPLPTQQKIASILSAYDDLIENNLRRIRLLEEAAQHLYREWFVRFRFPGWEEVKVVEGLPEGWKFKKAEEIFKINIGKTPPRNEAEWFEDGKSEIKWVSIRDMNNSSAFVLETSESITTQGVDKFNMNVAPKGTVILSFKLTIGAVAIVDEDMVTNEAIAHFNIPDKEAMNNFFTYCYLKNFNYETLGSTSSIGRALNSKIVKSMPFLLPDQIVIKLFGSISTGFFTQIRNLLTQNQKLKEARDILLPRLMNQTIEV